MKEELTNDDLPVGPVEYASASLIVYEYRVEPTPKPDTTRYFNRLFEEGWQFDRELGACILLKRVKANPS